MSTSTTAVKKFHYVGKPGQTRRETIHYTCAKCGHVYGGQVYRCINLATDPQLATLLAQRELNTLDCPSCGTPGRPNVPLAYHDPEGRRLVIMMPKGMRHLELAERRDFLNLIMEDPADAAEYAITPQVAYGVGGLARLLKTAREERKRELEEKSLIAEQTAELARRNADIDRREEAVALMNQRQSDLELRESEMVAREEDLQAKQEDLVSRRSRLVKEREELAKGWAELEREREGLRALSVELQAKERSYRERSRSAAAAEPVEVPPAPVPAEETFDSDKTPFMEKAPTPPPIPLEAELVEDGPGGPRVLDLDRRPRLEVDAWRAGEQPTFHIFSNDRVYLMAKLGAEEIQRFKETPPRIMIQLYGFAQGPLPVIAVLPGGDEDPVEVHEQGLYFLLNPEEDGDKDLLEHLTREFLVFFDIFDEEARPQISWGIEAPLAANVVDIIRRVEVQRDSMNAGDEDHRAAKQAYMALGAERLGRKQHNFSSDSFQELPTPAAVRLALGIVSYWSEPENQDYLVLVKSFPSSTWREIRLRVVKRALEYGLSLNPPLSDFALMERLSPSRDDLLRASVSNFAEVSLRIKPSDLDPQQEYENWKMLLSDCAVEGVQIDAEIEELAAGAAKRAKPVEVEEEILDLSVLPEAELLPLLAERDQRRDAALELCERGDAVHLEPVYNAVCNMTRAEVARVLPTLIQYGEPAVPLLIKGLRHRKSYVRQGSALALGQLKAKEGMEPLIDLLMSEPTNVWKEAARAIGDMGQRGLGALIAGAMSADGDERERIAWALAHGAMDKRGLAEVEAMARGKNEVLGKVASRALEVKEEVEAHDQEVRGARPMGEQTIVRGFSRQFFEALAGEVSELDDDYILDEEPILADDDLQELGGDALEEAVLEEELDEEDVEEELDAEDVEEELDAEEVLDAEEFLEGEEENGEQVTDAEVLDADDLLDGDDEDEEESGEQVLDDEVLEEEPLELEDDGEDFVDEEDILDALSGLPDDEDKQ
jgi:hypothetical protein